MKGNVLIYVSVKRKGFFLNSCVPFGSAFPLAICNPNPSDPFQIITPFRRLILCAENRKEMEDWISSLKSVQSREHYEVSLRQFFNFFKKNQDCLFIKLQKIGTKMSVFLINPQSPRRTSIGGLYLACSVFTSKKQPSNVLGFFCSLVG